jgi:hypothetical protein
MLRSSTTGSGSENPAVSCLTVRCFGSASCPQFGQKLVSLLLLNGVGIGQHFAEGFVR